MKPHKHANLIKQWADGAVIQFYDETCGRWLDVPQPEMYEDVEYRVKPKPVTKYKHVLMNGCVVSGCSFSITDKFYTNEEAKRNYPHSRIERILLSAKEFEQ
jgi:hypothetical protein